LRLNIYCKIGILHPEYRLQKELREYKNPCCNQA